MYPSLVLVQPRKTRSCLTERSLMGRKESNQIKQTNKQKTFHFKKVSRRQNHENFPRLQRVMALVM